MVEQRTENPRVAGSIPALGTICECSSSGRAPPCQGGGSEFEPRRPLQKKIRNAQRSLFHMVPWPSGKAKVCKTFIRQFKSGRYLHVEKPRFLDNFVENEVLRLLEPVAEQRVYLFRVENAEKMICKIMRAFCSTQPKMRHLFQKITIRTFFQIPRECDN